MIDLITQSQSHRVFDLEAQYLAPGTQSVALFSKLCMDRGEGAVLWDIDGNRYVDLLAGVGVASLGHGHRGFARALAEQASSVVVGSFASKVRADYMALLRDVLPPGLERVQLYSGGAEAVEAAVRLARSFVDAEEALRASRQQHEFVVANDLVWCAQESVARAVPRFASMRGPAAEIVAA
jgi:4-aminobutyrate aminotransferase-like enzyme